MNETLKKVKEIIAEQLGLDIEEVKEESSLQDFIPDSLDTVQIIMDLEDAFEINISDEEAEKLTTVAEIVRHIEDKKRSLQGAT